MFTSSPAITVRRFSITLQLRLHQFNFILLPVISSCFSLAAGFAAAFRAPSTLHRSSQPVLASWTESCALPMLCGPARCPFRRHSLPPPAAAQWRGCHHARSGRPGPSRSQGSRCLRRARCYRARPVVFETSPEIGGTSSVCKLLRKEDPEC